MTSSNPAAELVLLVTGYRVSQAIHVAATLGIADIIKDGAASASDLAVATNSHAGSSIPRAPGTRSGRRIP